jgi:hypothetical protein
MSEDIDIDDQVDTEQLRRFERFVALGGGVPLQQELRNLRKIEEGVVPHLADNVTPKHRTFVADLAASGVSHDAIAKMLGITRQYLEKLFDYELNTAFEFSKANLGRTLFLRGLAGDTQAATNWLRYHNRSDWGSKTQFTGKDAGPIDVDVNHKGKSLDEAKQWLGQIVSAMMLDKDLANKEPPKRPPVPGAKLKAPKPAKVKSTIKKPRQDDETEE